MYTKILYVGWPLHKDSTCGAGPYIRIFYVGWPLHKDSVCGCGHYTRILYVGWPHKFTLGYKHR